MLKKPERKIFYKIGRLKESQRWKLDFKDGLLRSVKERIQLGFILKGTDRPEAKPYRIFSATEDYRKWASKNLPKWLGYYLND